MKKIHIYLSIVTILLFVGALAYAQQTTGERINVSFSDPSKPGRVEVYVESGSITVSPHGVVGSSCGKNPSAGS